MTKKRFDRNGFVSLLSISSEEDLKPRPGININPPLADARCDCCGRHISELRPFGKAGDPLVGDFDGELLIKIFRWDPPIFEEVAIAWDKADAHFGKKNYNGCGVLEWMIKEYGKEEGERLYIAGPKNCQVRSSWECRNCVVLDTDEYFEQIDKTYNKKVNIWESSPKDEKPLPAEASATTDGDKDKSINCAETNSLPATASEDIDDDDLLAELTPIETNIAETLPRYKKSKHVMGKWIITEYHDGDVTIMDLAGNFELDIDGIMQNFYSSGPCVIPAWKDGEEIEFDPEFHALPRSNYPEQTAESYETKSLPATASEEIDDDDLLVELD